ncbi:MAG: hypothetical protein KKD39_02940 [Candidatus Altiarchaeota archaeon]|nr:hypothetical protein [Candidatus Altiarchaeota archaeon]
MDRFWAVLAVFAVIPFASAWSDYSSAYFCDDTVKTVWGNAVYNECLGGYSLQDQMDLCAMMPGNSREKCQAILDKTHPAVLPNTLGEDDLEYPGECPITKFPERTYLCSEQDKLTPKINYWLNISTYSDTRCHRVQTFCIASNYLSQKYNPFNLVLNEDPLCKSLMYKKVEESIKAQRTTWGFDQGCAFTYKPNAALNSESTYIHTININNRHKTEIMQELENQLRDYYTRPFSPIHKTTTTTLPVADCVKDSDCEIVQGDCCGCNAGGINAAVPKLKADDWLEELYQRCSGKTCMSVMSTDPSCSSKPVCTAGKCALESVVAEITTTIQSTTSTLQSTLQTTSTNPKPTTTIPPKAANPPKKTTSTTVLYATDEAGGDSTLTYLFLVLVLVALALVFYLKRDVLEEAVSGDEKKTSKGLGGLRERKTFENMPSRKNKSSLSEASGDKKPKIRDSHVTDQEQDPDQSDEHSE